MKNTLTVFILLAFTCPAMAMEHYAMPLQDQNGNAIAGATVTVYLTGTTTLATIYSDNGATAKSNPFTTPFNGVVDFYAANGQYDLLFTSPRNIFTADQTRRVVLFDPADGGGGGGGEATSVQGSTTVPSSCTGRSLYFDEDGTTGQSLYVCQGGIYVLQGDGNTTGGLDANFDISGGNIITGTSEAKRVDILGDAGQIANGATIFQHSDGNTYIDCIRSGVVGDCHKIVRLLATRYFQINDSSGGQMIRLDPGAASAALKYTIGAGHEILGAEWVPAERLIGDGTQCPTSATGAVLGSGPRVRTFICADNNASRLDGSLKLPYKWDTGAFTIIHVVVQTAADTNNVLGHFTCQVRGSTEAPNSSWATEVAMTTQAMTGSGAQNFITISDTITCNGTPAPGDMLYFKYELDATGTTTATATLHHVGFWIIWLTNTLSE